MVVVIVTKVQEHVKGLRWPNHGGGLWRETRSILIQTGVFVQLQCTTPVALCGFTSVKNGLGHIQLN